MSQLQRKFKENYLVGCIKYKGALKSVALKMLNLDDEIRSEIKSIPP